MKEIFEITGKAGAMAIDLDEMIRRYRPIVGFKVKQALGGGNPDWEDIVNEIMMQAVEKITSGAFRGDATIGTFIYTITARRIVDHIRRKTRVLKGAPEASAPPDPHDLIEQNERAERLAEAVKRLRPKFRDVLYLYYYKNLSRIEVARELGISPAKVSERVNYAQKLLRKMLDR